LRDLPSRTSNPRNVLVVGAGPAGTELACQLAEQGHTVRVWEKADRVGGLLNVAAALRANVKYAKWIAYQAERLGRLGVEVTFGKEATADDVLAAGADVVAIATGSTPRLPNIAGIDGPNVMLAAAVARGTATPGRRVAVLCEDDGPAPLSVSDHLAGLGHEVTLIVQSNQVAPLVGKYSIGSMLAQLVDGGVRFVHMARVDRIEGDTLHLASTYGTRRWTEGPFDSVVVAAGSQGNDSLFRELKGRHPAVHILGDAFAPRRVVFATRQAFELSRTLL
jgi:NADPH-dependent 2,4-dienoyl-CoA reductase/sulfur reductase-like enzyme